MTPRRAAWTVAVVLAAGACAIVAQTTQRTQPASRPAEQTPQQTAKALRRITEQNLKAFAAEDVPGIMETIHSDSPLYERTKRIAETLRSGYALGYELLDFRYVGRDGKYAFARARQKTFRISGAPFRDNITDALHVYRRENEQWKFWSVAMLETELLAETGESPRRPNDF